MEQDWEKWTPENVVEWLTSKKLGHLGESFYKIKVTGEHLARMDDSFLKTYLKVSSQSERNTILQSLSHFPNIGSKNFVHPPTSPLGQNLYTEIAGKRPPPKPKTDLEAQALINSPDNLHSGWIIKQGGRIRTWRRRYMVLHTGCLYYFENEKSQKQKGSLSLPGYVLTEYNELKDYPNCCIKLAHKNPNKRVYFICTSSQREKEKWIESIQKEIDLYKEENLLGQAIYGAMVDEPNCNGKIVNLSEVISDEDNDDDDVSPINQTLPRNIPPKHIQDQPRFYSANKLSKSDNVAHTMADHSKIVHANTMKPKITLTNSSSYDFSLSSTMISPTTHSTLPFPGQAILPSEPPISSVTPPDLTEDQYLVILHGNPSQTNGLAQRELPSVPERLPLASVRPLPTVPSRDVPTLSSFPSSLSSDNLYNHDRRTSAPSLVATSRDSMSDLPVKPLPNKPQELRSYVDVEGDLEDFSQLSDTFSNTLKGVSAPPAHPLPDTYDNMECNEDDGDAYIAPLMEVLPESCIQSGFTRDKAESVLANINHDGMYLIRSSSEENISMVLTVWCKDKCKHYKIFKLEKGYCLHRGTYFSSLEELILQYRVSTLPKSNYTLKVPYNIFSSKHT